MLDKLVDRFPLPPTALPIGDTSLTHVMKLPAHSTKPPTPTTMVQSSKYNDPIQVFTGDRNNQCILPVLQLVFTVCVNFLNLTRLVHSCCNYFSSSNYNLQFHFIPIIIARCHVTTFPIKIISFRNSNTPDFLLFITDQQVFPKSDNTIDVV
jgi:hypothetical protein